jgi:hypothetical protein
MMPTAKCPYTRRWLNPCHLSTPSHTSGITSLAASFSSLPFAESNRRVPPRSASIYGLPQISYHGEQRGSNSIEIRTGAFLGLRLDADDLRR